MNNHQFTYPYPWEEDRKPRWERRGYDPIRQAYVSWLRRYPWDLFVSVNFRQKQIHQEKKNFHKVESYVQDITIARWGAPSDVESRLKVMDARVCKQLLGRKWASKTSERPEWVGFMERDEDGFAHAHLLVNLKEIDSERFKSAFTEATQYFSPRADVRPEGAFKDVYNAEGAIDYAAKYLNNPYKECALVASPTFRKNVQITQGAVS